MGIVCDSSIDLGKVLTVEFTSAGTLTTFPRIDNCPPPPINLSSKGVKFKHCSFTGNPILFALEQSVSKSILYYL